VGVQSECHVQNQKGHYHGPKGPMTKGAGSSVHDAQQLLLFRALNDIVRYTTEELLSFTT
jgi:hypothetical protein